MGGRYFRKRTAAASGAEGTIPSPVKLYVPGDWCGRDVARFDVVFRLEKSRVHGTFVVYSHACHALVTHGDERWGENGGEI